MLPEASSMIALIVHVAFGGAISVVALSAFYASSLFRLMKLRQQQSES
jgi:hypothetical protein